MKIQITALFSGSVLFEHEAENNTVSLTLVAAVKARANLTRANLDGAYLAGANLDGAYLAGANLGCANLDGANLDGAYLARANLARANLGGANLDGAYLARANLGGANLDGANLTRANLDGAYLAGANLGGANLDGANLARANLARASLDGAYLGGANLDGEVLNKAPISLINLQWSILITGQYMRIGCQRHTHEEWRDFTDAKIRDMAIDALAFWRKWKAPLLAICHANHEAPAATDPVGAESDRHLAGVNAALQGWVSNSTQSALIQHTTPKGHKPELLSLPESVTGPINEQIGIR